MGMFVVFTLQEECWRFNITVFGGRGGGGGGGEGGGESFHMWLTQKQTSSWRCWEEESGLSGCGLSTSLFTVS